MERVLVEEWTGEGVGVYEEANAGERLFYNVIAGGGESLGGDGPRTRCIENGIRAD